MLQKRAVTKRDICPSSESLSGLSLEQSVKEVLLETIATILQCSRPMSRQDAMFCSSIQTWPLMYPILQKRKQDRIFN